MPWTMETMVEKKAVKRLKMERKEILFIPDDDAQLTRRPLVAYGYSDGLSLFIEKLCFVSLVAHFLSISNSILLSFYFFPCFPPYPTM